MQNRLVDGQAEQGLQGQGGGRVPGADVSTARTCPELRPAALACVPSSSSRVVCTLAQLIFSVRRILDNLPIAIAKLRDENGQAVKTYERGFPVGIISVRSPSLSSRSAASSFP